LKAVVSDEGGLDGMQRVAPSQAFDRQDLRAVAADRQRKAGIDSPPVDVDRAGAALPAVAALLGPGQIEAFAKEIEQRDPWVVQLEPPRSAVDGEGNGYAHAFAPMRKAKVVLADGRMGAGLKPHYRETTANLIGIWRFRAQIRLENVHKFSDLLRCSA
jgi:hypothetical protein